MSLEGNLRDLALPEVCQLLAHTRKSGELRLRAPLAGLTANILFESGAIVGATIDGLGIAPLAEVDPFSPDAAQQVESTTLELLCWSDGEFRFVPQPTDGGVLRTGVRLTTELLLMEGARRSEEWARLSDLIPNSRAVPAFVDVEPRQLPLLNLEPQQWEVLTGVDGQRDLPALARALSRDLLEVAEIVHGLIGTGLLKLVDATRVLRTQATPPSSAAEPGDTAVDLWVPAANEAGSAVYDDDENDEIFDPVRVGVITPEGLPRLRTPAAALRVAAGRVRPGSGSASGSGSGSGSASTSGNARELGDAAARRGDLGEAVRYWNATLVQNSQLIDSSSFDIAEADRSHAREAIALVTRLQLLLYVHQVR